MSWFKVDDGFYRHRKVRKLRADRLAGVGLWTLAGDWAADNLTDGFVPDEVLEDWDDDLRLAGRLVEVGLWERAIVDGEDGIVFHDWADWQPTRDQVLARRKEDAERKARWRERQKSRAESRRDATRDETRDATPDSQQESQTPDPTRPDPGPLFEGDPGAGGAERPPTPDRPVPGTPEAEEVRSRGIALVRAALPPPKHRSGAQRRADAERARQDALAELDAVQADPSDDPGHVPRSASPGAVHPSQLPDQQEEVA